MPIRRTTTKKGIHQVLKNTAFENEIICCFMKDVWQVFSPICDSCHQTGVLISDGPNYYRIQVKTVEASEEDHQLENRWKDSHVDVVIAFAGILIGAM
ncbi:MAG: hypothetical protein ACN4GF_07240 [Lentimonas sp.]